MTARVAAIEKWTAVADICRCLHNFNGVLQICAAFTNAAVYRLKKTWDKVPRTVSTYLTIMDGWNGKCQLECSAEVYVRFHISRVIIGSGQLFANQSIISHEFQVLRSHHVLIEMQYAEIEVMVIM